MAAHLRSIVRICDWPGCAKTATQELRNTWNAVIGVYCSTHASRALKKFQEEHEGAKTDA